ncbi:MAG: flippase-like domain-containing protein [Gammaproteobacteria bacterium]|nr:flippase-like domain-containing protein [Gammaproteobacteria bacterium]NNL51712.1 flippase-like domain-containing protein [Woeseiaceae bacterium]
MTLLSIRIPTGTTEIAPAINRARLIAVAKLLLGISLIAVLLNAVDVTALLERYRSINFGYLAAVFILPHVAMLLSTIKWQLLLNTLSIRIGLGRLFSLYMIGTFFSNFLPTMVGGDVYKSYALSRETGDTASVLAATFLERFIGLTALVSLLPLVLFQDAVRSAVPTLGLVVIGILASYLLLLALVASPMLDRFGALAPKQKIVQKVWNFVSKTHACIQRFGGRRNALVRSFLLSLVFYIFVAGTAWSAAMSIEVQIDFLYLLAITPMVLLAAAAPISLNGLGIAEAGYVIFFQLIGVTAEDALGIALLLRMRLVVTALLGGIIFMWLRSHSSQIDAPDEIKKKADIALRDEQNA